MKRKNNFFVIRAIVFLLLAAGAGFAFGFDIGRITNDQERIKNELSRISVSQPAVIPPVARSETGKMEIKVLTDYLEEFRKYADNLQRCSDSLDVLEKRSEDAGTISEITLIRLNNEQNYLKMKELVEEPQKFIGQRTEEYGSEYRAWVEDWCEDLQAAECRSVWEGRFTELYENNRTRLENKQEEV